MPGEERLQKRHEDSESDEEEEEEEVHEADAIPKIDIDPSTLTPLSPEVISKQVSTGGLIDIHENP
jgi:translation initiation factor 2 subunit 3